MDNLDSILKMFGDSMSSDSSKMSSILNILQGMSSNEQAKDSQNETNSSFDMPDMETIMMITKIFSSLKVDKDDPRANLLYALKPYLDDSKKDKIDQYVKMLGIFNVLSSLNNGGDGIGNIFKK